MRTLEDPAVEKFGQPETTGNPVRNQKPTGRTIGKYEGIDRDPAGARYRIDLPAVVANVTDDNGQPVIGDLFSDDKQQGEREARRYVAERLKIAVAPKAVPI